MKHLIMDAIPYGDNPLISEETLDGLAAEGWSLITIVRVRDGLFHLYFVKIPHKPTDV